MHIRDTSRTRSEENNMKVIQSIYTDGANPAMFTTESDVTYTLDMFNNAGLISVEDNQRELENVIEVGLYIYKDRNCKSPHMHNPATFSVTTESGVQYDGNVTESGNIFVLQTVYDGDEVYQAVGFVGARGRYIVELENMLHLLKHIEPECYQDISDISKGLTPEVYESSGPDDMFPYEDAYAYAIRMYNKGNTEHVIYWLKKAVASLSIGDTPPATANSIVYYIGERDS